MPRNHPRGSRKTPRLELPESLTQHLETVRLSPERPVYRPAQVVRQFYVVRQGLLGNFRLIEPDKQILTGKRNRGDPVGVSQLLQDAPFPGRLTPLKETVAYRGSRSDMERFKRKHPQWITDVLLHENQNQARLYQKLEDYVSMTLAQRIAQELLDLADRLGRQTPLGIEILMDLTRRKLSRMVGSASESVVRIVSRWEKNGWMLTRSKRITICKPMALWNCVLENNTRTQQQPVP